MKRNMNYEELQIERGKNQLWQGLGVLRDEIPSQDLHVYLFLLSAIYDKVIDVEEFKRVNSPLSYLKDVLTSNENYKELYAYYEPILNKTSVHLLFKVFDRIAKIYINYDDEIFSVIFNDLLDQLLENQGQSSEFKSLPNEISYFVNQMARKYITENEFVYNPFAGTASLFPNCEDEPVFYWGQEIRPSIWVIGKLRLLRKINEHDNYFYLEDSIKNWRLPDINEEYDLVISNPPFGMKIDSFYLGDGGSTEKITAVEFVIHKGMQSLVYNGSIFCVSSMGLLHRGGSEGEMREWLVEENYLDTVVYFPEGLLKYTSIPFCLVIVSKDRKSKDKVRMINTADYIITERSHKILDSVKLLKDIDSSNPCDAIKMVSIDEIRNNQYNISVERFFPNEINGVSTIYSMTLHEAIEHILQESGKSMTSEEIADIINKRKLYQRADKKDVSASQVNSRVNNYNKIFTKVDEKIKLVKDDPTELAFHKFFNELALHSKNKSSNNELLNKSIYERVTNNIREFELLNNNLAFFGDSDSFNSSTTNQSTAKLKTFYRAINETLKSNRSLVGEPSELLASILSGLNWFNNVSNIISIDFDGSHHFLMKLAIEHTSSNFRFVRKDPIQKNIEDNPPIAYNEHIYKLIEGECKLRPIHQELINTRLIIPPFGPDKKSETLKEFEQILSEIRKPKSSFQKVILIVPNSCLTNSHKQYKKARIELLKSKHLESITSLPNGVFQNVGVDFSMLIFNFEKDFEEILTLNSGMFLSENEDDKNTFFNILNNRIEKRGVSRLFKYDRINSGNFNLSPYEYIIPPVVVRPAQGTTVYHLREIVKYYKFGRPIPRKNIYTGGEYRLIRPSDISRESDYLEPNLEALGADKDGLGSSKDQIVSGGIVVSGLLLQNKLKAAILSNDDNYVIDHGIFWLNLNKSIVLEEYLVNELAKPYVTKQVEYLAQGTNSSFLMLKDFLNIEVQLPTIEVQKELVLNKLRKPEAQTQKEGVSQQGMDFVKTLKHTFKQPLSTLGNDLTSLREFINNKVANEALIDSNEPIVPIFPGDNKEIIDSHRLSVTLKRMGRAITDMDYILNQAMQIITAGAVPEMESIEFKSFLNNFVAENPDIDIHVLGKELECLADRKQLRMLVANFIDNAKRHGFEDFQGTPTIWLEIIPKDDHALQLSIRNNGAPMPPEFTVLDFLAKSSSTKGDVGSGFGGFLIGQILKNHKGEIQLFKTHQSNILPHTVEFLITLPK